MSLESTAALAPVRSLLGPSISRPYLPPAPTSSLPPIPGPAIYHFQQIGQGFWEPLLIAIGIAESYRVAVGWATPTGTGFNSLKDDYEPGDLGFDPLGLKPTEPEALKEMQTKELNNGRLVGLEDVYRYPAMLPGPCCRPIG